MSFMKVMKDIWCQVGKRNVLHGGAEGHLVPGEEEKCSSWW
ncbi:hypothetical protein [Bacillus sp. OK048]|nr:hypothetical protein [Bacillus sp. OK048]